MGGIKVRRSGGRFETRAGWLDSRHWFSFGPHYAPDNTDFGLLLVHQDSGGHQGVVYPGLAQRMSAGRGIRHSEENDSWRLAGAGPHRGGRRGPHRRQRRPPGHRRGWTGRSAGLGDARLAGLGEIAGARIAG
jgi:hypothetical protein